MRTRTTVNQRRSMEDLLLAQAQRRVDLAWQQPVCPLDYEPGRVRAWVWWLLGTGAVTMLAVLSVGWP